MRPFDVGEDAGTPVVEDYAEKIPYRFKRSLKKFVRFSNLRSCPRRRKNICASGNQRASWLCNEREVQRSPLALCPAKVRSQFLRLVGSAQAALDHNCGSALRPSARLSHPYSRGCVLAPLQSPLSLMSDVHNR